MGPETKDESRSGLTLTVTPHNSGICRVGGLVPKEATLQLGKPQDDY